VHSAGEPASLASVTWRTQDLEAYRETLLYQPPVEGAAASSSDSQPVPLPVARYVVHGQSVCTPAACAGRSVVLKD